MKKKYRIRPKLLYGVMALLLWCSGSSGQGLLIGKGAHVVTSGDATIFISNGHWTNNGNFHPGFGKVNMSVGNHSGGQYFLRGDSVTTFYHLITHTFPTAVITVQQDAYVIARWDMSGHLSSAGDADIILLPGAVLGSNTGLLTGNNGRVITTVLLDRPQRFDPGNLGMEITSNENLGHTTVVRGFREQVNAAGEKSIERYYDIIPSRQPTRPVTLRFSYDDKELNGNSKSRLAVFSGKPGSRLMMLPDSKSDGANNRISASRVTQLDRFTLANAIAVAQPLEAPFSLKAYPNPFRDKFVVTVHSGTAKTVELRLLSVQGSVLERRTVKLQAGNNIIEWPAVSYPQGTYQLMVGGEFNRMIRLVKQ